MRLISLCPSLTETVFDLGRGQDLIGRTRYCVEPADRIDAVEALGGTKDPELARIVALAPDLVLLNQEENRVEDHDALLEAGLRCHVSFPRTPEDVPPHLRDLGSQLEATAAGERLATEVERALSDHRSENETSFVYLVWRKPWMAAGPDTFVSGLLETVGGYNALRTPEPRYGELDPEDLAKADPEWVLLPTEPFPFQTQHAEQLAHLSGLPLERFRLVDGQRLSWHGSRTRFGLPYAASCLV